MVKEGVSAVDEVVAVILRGVVFAVLVNLLDYYFHIALQKGGIGG